MNEPDEKDEGTEGDLGHTDDPIGDDLVDDDDDPDDEGEEDDDELPKEDHQHEQPTDEEKE